MVNLDKKKRNKDWLEKILTGLLVKELRIKIYNKMM